MQILRRFSQGAVLVGCLVLLSGLLGAGEKVLEWLPRFSPLMAVSGRVAARGWVGSFAPALALVVLGLLSDRFFCRWICPVGTMSDVLDRVWAPRAVSAPVRSGSRLPLFLLLALVGVSFTGAELAGWLDPLALLAREIDGSATPQRDAVHRLLVLSGRGGFWGREALHHQLQMFAVLVLVLALGLTIRGRRAWCRAVCPLGALYGALSRMGCNATCAGNNTHRIVCCHRRASSG